MVFNPSIAIGARHQKYVPQIAAVTSRKTPRRIVCATRGENVRLAICITVNDCENDSCDNDGSGVYDRCAEYSGARALLFFLAAL